MIPITSPKTLGKVLRSHRKSQGLTQIEVGKKINLLQTTISNIEQGKQDTRMETIFKYMTALGLEMHLEPRDKLLKEEALW